MTLSDRVTFLQERTPLAVLQPDSLRALARSIQVSTVPPGQTIVEAAHEPDGLYILLQGKLETEGSGIGGISFLPGTVLNLEALLLEQSVEQTVKALCDSTLWFVEKDQFLQVVEAHPDILQTFTRQLVEAVKRLSFQFNYEQERQAVLRPYLVNRAKRGVIGRSRYAERLRNQIRNAGTHRRPVLLFGEPGLEKDNLAALVHFGSTSRREPMIQLDCSKLQASGAELFGRAGGKPGLLAALGRGTLVLSDPKNLDEDLVEPVARLLQTQRYRPVDRPGIAVAPELEFQGRIILISEQAVPELAKIVQDTIKVPPLRVRKADLEDQVQYYLSLICRQRRRNRIQVTPEAIRRLQSYDFPNNLPTCGS